MLKLITIKDNDIFPDKINDQEVVYEPRLAVKVIIVDENNKLALVGTKYRLLPGGGVEDGEDLTQAVKRECLEEVGCEVEIEKEVAVTEEYRAQIRRHQTTHFFLAKVVGNKNLPITTQADEQGMQTDWVILEEAISVLEREVVEIPFASYHTCFNVRTHLAVLNKIKDLNLIKK